MSNAARGLLPLVQTPPRAVWGRSGQPVCATAEDWLGRPLQEKPSPDEMVRRYLAAFGPATVNDMQMWSGLTRLGEVTERLRPGLCVFRDEHGRELFDLPGAPRPDPDIPAPPRFIAEFDNLLLSHADRTRVVSEDDRKRLFTVNGIIPGTILVNGFVRGAWKITKQRGAAILAIEPFRLLSKKDTAALTSAGGRLPAFAAPEAESHGIRVSTGR